MRREAISCGSSHTKCFLGARAGALRELDVNRVARKWREARSAQLVGADHRLDRTPADRHVRGAARLVARGAGLRDGIRVRSARVPEPLLLGEGTAARGDREVLATLGGKGLESL